ncbi:hypothetical protein HaLaN_13712 [Haematococcus lacustris]|uniref:Uncharacterized protein n=1 Tax=Haematococcus lacustris TaxID=44745 RepID=A0A699Z3G8_HAELA|nr:hypothetical protein HaLaN_13712 [Haematococcus lacustris]
MHVPMSVMRIPEHEEQHAGIAGLLVVIPSYSALTCGHTRHMSGRLTLEPTVRHITITLATWAVIWEVYPDFKRARQRCEAQEWALHPSGGQVKASHHSHEG